MFLHYGWGFGFPWFGFFWLFLVLFWLIPGWRWRRHGHYRHWHGTGEKSAEDILSERYARGEISHEEFEDRMTVLKKHTK